MKIVVAGASGTIGSELVPFLLANGVQVVTLQRKDPTAPNFWDPEKGVLATSLEGADAVINLAGSSIFSRLWTKKNKGKILNSRVQSTRLLVDAIKKLANPPQVLINASATGFYGSCGDKELDETCSQGRGFLAEVCGQWEQEALKAQDAGTRVVLLRIGMVLTPRGGALAKMVPACRFGLGATFGSGNQWMSWIAIEDLLLAIRFCLEKEGISGPVNLVTGHPVPNREFTHTLASVLHRPTWLRLPAFLLRLFMGEMADEVLLSSAKVYPAKLLTRGFTFRHDTLQQALGSFFT